MIDHVKRLFEIDESGVTDGGCREEVVYNSSVGQG
jgi:hypothetical protein